MKRGPFEQYENSHTQLWILGLLCLVLFTILALGLAYRQIILNQNYLNQENVQSLRQIISTGPRGNIYDRNNNLLVGNKAKYCLVLYLSELREEFRKTYIQNVKKTREQNLEVSRTTLRKEARFQVIKSYLDTVGEILGRPISFPQDKLEKHFHQRLLLPITLIENLSTEDFALLTDKLPIYSPLQINIDSIRYYPFGRSACHVLGYTGVIQEDESLKNTLATFAFQGKVGKNGLEKSFDTYLKGINGQEVWRVDPSGFQCQLIHQSPPRQGGHLISSLDIHLQQIAEKAMGDMKGAVVAIEVKTKEVLVMLSKPDYNLSDFSPKISQEVYNKVNKSGAWLNRALQGIYPAGSPFKIVTSIAAFKANVMDEQVTCHCPGYLQVGNRKFPCLKRSGHGDIQLPKALAISCNVLFFDKALATGINAFSSEIKRLGFGQMTGVELPYESQITLVPTPEWKKKKRLGSWLGGDTANLSIGQGYLLVTPLQMACFTAAFANKKARITPTMIHKNLKPEHEDDLELPDIYYDKIVEGLELAVIEGSARRARVENVRVAAKTGTAQVKIKNGAMDVVWCVAFAPVENPEIAVAVLVEESTEDDNFWGSRTAAPIAGKVLNAYFKNQE